MSSGVEPRIADLSQLQTEHSVLSRYVLPRVRTGFIEWALRCLQGGQFLDEYFFALRELREFSLD